MWTWIYIPILGKSYYRECVAFATKYDSNTPDTLLGFVVLHIGNLNSFMCVPEYATQML